MSKVFPLDRRDIHAALKKAGYEKAELDKDTEQVSVVIEIEDVEFPLFLKVLGEGTLLQLLMFIPARYEKKSVADLSRLLHSINKEVDFPGFGIDETSRTIFYRTVTPSLSKEISEELLLALVQGAITACQSFLHPVAAVASGELTFDDLLEKLQEAADKMEEVEKSSTK